MAAFPFAILNSCPITGWATNLNYCPIRWLLSICHLALLSKQRRLDSPLTPPWHRTLSSTLLISFISCGKNSKKLWSNPNSTNKVPLYLLCTSHPCEVTLGRAILHGSEMILKWKICKSSWLQLGHYQSNIYWKCETHLTCTSHPCEMTITLHIPIFISHTWCNFWMCMSSCLLHHTKSPHVAARCMWGDFGVCMLSCPLHHTKSPHMDARYMWCDFGGVFVRLFPPPQKVISCGCKVHMRWLWGSVCRVVPSTTQSHLTWTWNAHKVHMRWLWACMCQVVPSTTQSHLAWPFSPCIHLTCSPPRENNIVCLVWKNFLEVTKQPQFHQ